MVALLQCDSLSGFEPAPSQLSYSSTAAVLALKSIPFQPAADWSGGLAAVDLQMLPLSVTLCSNLPEYKEPLLPYCLCQVAFCSARGVATLGRALRASAPSCSLGQSMSLANVDPVCMRVSLFPLLAMSIRLIPCTVLWGRVAVMPLFQPGRGRTTSGWWSHSLQARMLPQGLACIMA